ncbi:MAG: type IX secretion system protein PorQ [Prevotella sp.]|nr:type IX secretion system protein PorQ [Candidatus Prevotella equi]
MTSAQESQSVYNHLQLPTSAHGAALGGENISIIEDDASLALSNPALLSSVSHMTVGLGYMNYMSGAGLFSANYTHVINDKATIGGAATYLSYGSMTERDAYGAEMGTFTPSDLNIEGIFSYTLAKNLVGGIAAKFLYSKIGHYNSSALAVDLGLNYYQPTLDFSASIAVKNLGGQLSAFNDEYEPLPINLSIGFSQRIHKTPLRVSLTFADLTHWDYSFLQHACIGLDVIIIPQFYIAGGVNLKRMQYMKVTNVADGESSTHGAGWSVGCGLTLDRFKAHFSYGKYHMASQSLMFNLAYSL